MKILTSVLSFATLLGACSSSEPTGGCPAGQVPGVNGACTPLCNSNRDCPTGELCANDGRCAPASGPAPRILDIDGDGSPDANAGQAANHVAGGLVITGTDLGDVTVSLAGADAGLPSVDALAIRAGATDTRLEVDLPPSLDEGTYLLTVANQFGADQATTVVLQGEPGPAGAPGVCDAAACTSQTLPGAAVVSSVLALGANGVSADQSLLLDGAEIIGAPADGIYLLVLDRLTHQPSADPDHDRNYSLPANLGDLLVELAALGEEQIAILVSRGDVGSHMETDVGGNTLRGAMARLGAGAVAADMGPAEAFVLVGRPGLGRGNASLVVSTTGLAEASAILVDGAILGPHTGDALGRSIGRSELSDDAVGPVQLAGDSVAGRHIIDGSIGAGDLGTGAVDGRILANGSVDSPELATDSVRATHVAPGAVGADALADGAVRAAAIATAAVTADAIGTNAVGAVEIASGAVGSLELAADSVTSAKIDNFTIQSDDLGAGSVDRAAVFGAEVPLYLAENSFCETRGSLTLDAQCETFTCSPGTYWSCAGSCGRSSPGSCDNTLVGHILTPNW